MKYIMVNLLLMFYLTTFSNYKSNAFHQIRKFSIVNKITTINEIKSPKTLITKINLAPEVSEIIINNSNPSSINFWYEVYNQSVMTFINSFNSRLIGTIIGNIVAGFVFKFAFDKFNELIKQKDNNDKNMKLQEKEKETSFELPNIDLITWGKLFLCIIIDLFGDASFLVPGVGELEDVAWAPISAFLLRSLFSSNTIGFLEFSKEILPFTDIIPLATSVWLLENVFYDNKFAELLQINNKSKLKK